MSEIKTICYKCRFHYQENDNRPNCQDIWYNQYCSHPAVRKDNPISPVTGKLTYKTQEDCMPHCREINNGDCKYFERKDK